MKTIKHTLVAASCLLSLPAAAATDEQIAALHAQMSELVGRLDALEAENAELRKASADTLREIGVGREQMAALEKRSKKASWADRIRWKGDFRYRYENIDEENKDDRDRNRIRARASLEATLPDNVRVGIGVASGGDDPVSTNQTLGGGGSTKDIRLDLAYAKWQATENLSIVGGKFKNIWYRPQKNGLLFDSDFNPEGMGLLFKKDWFFADLVGTWLESDTKGRNNSYSWGGQLGYEGKVGGAKVTTGVGYYNFETADHTIFYGDDDDFFGNSFECEDVTDLSTCTYLYDYNIVQAFGEVSMKVQDMPVSMFFDYVVNDDADEYDTGYAVGVKLGKAKKPGTWQLAYVYQDLERDAVLGLITDSDFGGGGTDAKGHVFKGAWAVNNKWSLGFTYFMNEIGENVGRERDYDRVMIDTKFKY